MSKPVPYTNQIIVTIPFGTNERYVSLDNLAEGNSLGKNVIRSWIRMRDTLLFLEEWEMQNNPDFSQPAFSRLLAEHRKPKFSLTVKEWLLKTGAIGLLRSKKDGKTQTYAHPDVALEFAAFLSPKFRIYLYREFQRLKEEKNARSEHELKRKVRRELSKINYRIHTEAVRKFIPPKVDELGKKSTLASEGDLLNIALFGVTAKEWRVNNTDKKGNIRDEATLEQLAVLANIENLNAYLIEHGFEQDERLELLNHEAIKQMKLLLSYNSVKGLEKLGEGEKGLLGDEN